MGDWSNEGGNNNSGSGFGGFGGGFGPGPLVDWLQGFAHNVTGGIKAMGFPRPEAVRSMDDFALRSFRRHLEARRADLDDLLMAINTELARRESQAPESSSPGSPTTAPDERG